MTLTTLQHLGQAFDAGWQDMASAPRDGRYILAVIAENDSRHLGHCAGRMFVIRHGGKTSSDFDLGWNVFPGLGGTPDFMFSHWMPLPAPPAADVSVGAVRGLLGEG